MTIYLKVIESIIIFYKFLRFFVTDARRAKAFNKWSRIVATVSALPGQRFHVKPTRGVRIGTSATNLQLIPAKRVKKVWQFGKRFGHDLFFDNFPAKIWKFHRKMSTVRWRANDVECWKEILLN